MFRFTRKFLPIISPFIKTPFNCFCKQNKKSTIIEQMHQLSQKIQSSHITQDYSELVSSYIELTEDSFIEFVKKQNVDPQILLMLISTFQNQKQVCDFLPILYPSINFFQKSEMLLLLQKVLAFKPSTKPKIPHPKPLEGIQRVLVILGELYPGDKLDQWIKYIPLYSGNSYYVLAMGYFSILHSMSFEAKNKNRALLVRCHGKFVSALKDPSNSTQLKSGIVSLAFELKYKQALPLYFQANLNLQALDQYKLCLLLSNLSIFLSQNTQIDEQYRNLKAEKAAEKEINQIIQILAKTNFQSFIKIDIFLNLWQSLQQKKKLQGSSLVLIDKLAKQSLQSNFQTSMKQLNQSELLIIIETMQKHKINKEKLLKHLLILMSDKIVTMNKKQLIKLLKCLVTYVRQCEKYLLDVGKIIWERKIEFSENQRVQINKILKRVSVLFPSHFAI